jgi:hypothetical protein
VNQGGGDPVPIRALKDIARGEREMRSKMEERMRAFIALLTKLAYKVDGLKMEDARRQDPLAPADWGPAEWEAHFDRALTDTVAARWAAPADPENEQLRGRMTELQGENERLRSELAAERERKADRVPERSEEPLQEKPKQESRPKPAAVRTASTVGWPQSWPPCPDRFRAALTAAQINDERLRRAQMVLWLIATRGLSAYMEIANEVAAQVGIKGGGSGSFQRLGNAMVKAGLINMQMIHVASNSHRYRLQLALLTQTGAEMVNAFGWKPIESEWERLRRLHQADTQTEHAGAILSLALNARRHGYAVELIPEVAGPSEPDAKLTKGGEVEYVEVELGNEKHRKWKNLNDLQGHVALCAGSVATRQMLSAEVRLAKMKGKATDIESLIQISSEPDAGIWMEEW